MYHWFYSDCLICGYEHDRVNGGKISQLKCPNGCYFYRCDLVARIVTVRIGDKCWTKDLTVDEWGSDSALIEQEQAIIAERQKMFRESKGL
jgi:hypothetical protein